MNRVDSWTRNLKTEKCTCFSNTKIKVHIYNDSNHIAMEFF